MSMVTTRKKRTRYQIMYDLLSAAADGEKKTRIMYRSNLSYSGVNKYFKKLIENGILEERNNLYFLTEKGLLFYDLLQGYFERRGKDLNNQESKEIISKIKEMLEESESEK